MQFKLHQCQQLREALRDLCGRFPPEYHRRLDAEQGYPVEFLDALTEAGWLATMIPQEYGGAGLGLAEASVVMEEINRCGGNAGHCHGQMYNMGTPLRHGSQAQKRTHLPRIASGELRQRERTGRGCRIDVSMLGATAEWMSYALYYAFDGAEPPPRTGASHATIYPYGPFPAGDGGSVLFGVRNEREWQAFCERVLERPQRVDDERFSDNSARLASSATRRTTSPGCAKRKPSEETAHV